MGKVKRGYKQWTQREVNEAIKMYHDGMNFAQIGRQLNRGASTIFNKLKALGIKSNKKMLWDVLEIRDNIINVDEAKQVTHGSEKRILFKCSTIDCDSTKMMFVYNLVRQGYSCPTCSKGTSYGQLAFQSYQAHFKLGYEAEKVLPTLDNRRVDFVKFDDKGNVINFVEIQGIQHTDVNSQWYEDAHEQDTAKRKWSKETNTLMIELDMRVSSWDYFKEQINNCEYLPSIKGGDETAILEIMELNRKYPVKEIIDAYLRARKSTVKIAKYYGYDASTIGNILRRNNVPTRTNTNSRFIKCVETGGIYQSSVEAGKEFGINRSNITACLTGNKHSAGKHPTTGEPLHWTYLSNTEENAFHRASLVSQQDKLDTIELDSSIDLLAIFNKEKV